MSIILRRPMFRGGSTGQGITSVPRKGYANSDEDGVQSDDTSSKYTTAIDKTLAKDLLVGRPDPLGKFLINFGLNYMSARPRSGRFGALTTAADAAKKPTEQLYADIDADRLFKLKLYTAMSKKESSVADVKKAKAAAETRNAPNSPYKGLSYNEAFQRAYQDILRSSLEQKKLTNEARIIEQQKLFAETNPSVGRKKAEIEIESLPKLKNVNGVNEYDNLALTNRYINQGALVRIPNSTDKRLENPPAGIDKIYKPGLIYIDIGTRDAFRYQGNNSFRLVKSLR